MMRRDEHSAGWTDERIERMRVCWGEGLSASQIAKDLGGGLTRNGVIGKLHRLGLKRGRQPARIPERKPRQPRAPAPTKSVMRAVPVLRANGSVSFRMKPKTVLAGDAADIQLPAAPDSAFQCTVMDLTETTCRWPMGDPGDLDTFRYCGSSKDPAAGPYCKFHARVAYQPPAVKAKREKEAA